MQRKKYDILLKKVFYQSSKWTNLRYYIKYRQWVPCKFFFEELYEIYFVYICSALLYHTYNRQITAYIYSWLLFEYSDIIDEDYNEENIMFNVKELYPFFFYSDDYNWLSYKLKHIEQLNNSFIWKLNSQHVIRDFLIKSIKLETFQFFFEKVIWSKIENNSFLPIISKLKTKLKDKYFLLKSKNFLVKIWTDKNGVLYDKEFIPAWWRSFLKNLFYYRLFYRSKKKYFFFLTNIKIFLFKKKYLRQIKNFWLNFTKQIDLFKMDWCANQFKNINLTFSILKQSKTKIFWKSWKKKNYIREFLLDLRITSWQRKWEIKFLWWKPTLFFNDSYFFYPITEDFWFKKWNKFMVMSKKKIKIKRRRGWPTKAETLLAKELEAQKKIKVWHRWFFSYWLEKNFYYNYNYGGIRKKNFFFSTFFNLYIHWIFLPKR